MNNQIRTGAIQGAVFQVGCEFDTQYSIEAPLSSIFKNLMSIVILCFVNSSSIIRLAPK